MADVQILAVPYDSGARGVRMGAGPERLLEIGLVDALTARGHAVEVEVLVPAPSPVEAEIATAFELARDLSGRVRSARSAGRFPLVLAGGCISAVGTVSGLGPSVAVLWLDTHADLNTPETTRSGFLDGMAAAVVAGWCWQPLARSVPGFRAVAPRDLVFVGVRDLDPKEAEAIGRHRVRCIGAAEALAELPEALQAWVEPTRDVYLHLDLDVMDPSDGRANRFATPGGLSRADLGGVLETVVRTTGVAAMTLSAYEPDADPDGRAADAAVDVLGRAMDALQARGRP